MTEQILLRIIEVLLRSFPWSLLDPAALKTVRAHIAAGTVPDRAGWQAIFDAFDGDLGGAPQGPDPDPATREQRRSTLRDRTA